MKHWLIVLSTVVLLYMPAIGHSGPKEDYEEAYKLSIMVHASVAAYSDRMGELTTSYLEKNGWNIDYYTQEHNQSGARFLLANKEVQGEMLYVLAIVGTENAKDIKLDLKVDKVYFAGSTFDEFAANATLQNIAATQPKVHRGFNDFIQAGPTAKLSTAAGSALSLRDILTAHQGNKLYLTGHSLGGAAAIIAGARFIDMGVNPEQLEVITFGSPAVGNAAFAAKFNPLLKVTRVVIAGDPVTGALQTLVGGYKQFGQEIKWDMPALAQNPHKIPSYVDIALKNYYDKRAQARQAGIELPTHSLAIPPITQNRVYIASLKNSLPPALMTDFPYMHEALLDEYRQSFPNCVFAEETAGENWREQAAAADCRWVIVPKASGIRLKNQQNTYRIILSQTVYETATGAVVDMATYSTASYNLTPLEAFIHAFKGFRFQEEDWLRKSSSPTRSAVTKEFH